MLNKAVLALFNAGSRKCDFRLPHVFNEGSSLSDFDRRSGSGAFRGAPRGGKALPWDAVNPFRLCCPASPKRPAPPSLAGRSESFLRPLDEGSLLTPGGSSAACGAARSCSACRAGACHPWQARSPGGMSTGHSSFSGSPLPPTPPGGPSRLSGRSDLQLEVRQAGGLIENGGASMHRGTGCRKTVFLNRLPTSAGAAWRPSAQS